MSRKVGNDCVSERGGDGATGGKTIESISEVYGIGTSDDNNRKEGDHKDTKVKQRLFEEWKAYRIDTDFEIG